MSMYTILLLAAVLNVSESQWRETVAVDVARINARLLNADVGAVQDAFSNQLRPQGHPIGMTHQERCAGASEFSLEWSDACDGGACKRAVIVFFDLRSRGMTASSN